MIAILFPFRHEAEDLLAQVTDLDSFEAGELDCITGKLGERAVVIIFTGMGLAAAGANAEMMFQYFRVKAVILAGYGGALVPQLKRGQVIFSNNYTTDDVLQFVRFMSGFDFGAFYSSELVLETPQQKATLAQATQCQVVDMETAAVAQSVISRGIPFIAIRAISDEAGEILPHALSQGYDRERQHMTPLRLVWYLLWHRKEISAFKSFVSNLAPVRKNLADFILELNKELPRGW